MSIFAKIFTSVITLLMICIVFVFHCLLNIYRLSLLFWTTSSSVQGCLREDDAFSLCSCVSSSTEQWSEWDKLFGTIGGTTILNLIASTDRTTCGRRLPACCYGANNKVEKRIQAARIVIHTFVPLWKSAQMFVLLEKMSQRPEKPFQVKMT